MKQKMALLLTIALTFGGLTACGSTGGTEENAVPEAVESEDAPQQESADAEETGEVSDKIVIGYSLKTVQEERWQRELDNCQAAADELGVEFLYQVANGEAQTQVSQIENLITQGVDVIMVTAVDSGALTSVLDEARNDGIKVVIYDQPLENTYADAFVGYDDYTNGQNIASVLADLNVSGNVVLLHGDKTSGIEQIVAGEKGVLENLDVNIVMEQYCQNWAAENALGYAQNALAEHNNDIQAFVCMNDGIAAGTIQALEEAGIAGDVVVTGMDCELTAVQRIAAGTQTSTLYKDSVALSRAAVETAVALAKGEELSTDKTINCGVNDMPHIIVSSSVITKDKIQSDLIDAGIYSEEEIYSK